MNKQDLVVMTIVVTLICVASLTLSLISPLGAQIVVFMLTSSAMLTTVALLVTKLNNLW